MQALGDLLKATHRGYVIPPRPEKSPVEGQRASADFVEGRRAALEHYLHQLAGHPVISRSQAGPLDAALSQHVRGPQAVLEPTSTELMWPAAPVRAQLRASLSDL